MDFSLHSYFSILYIVAFLPIVLVAYQVVAQRLRWAVLLVASYAFFWAISSKLIVFILISTVSVYLAGRKMGALFSERDAIIAQDKTRKKELKKLYQKKARLVCGLGVGFNLLLLACLRRNAGNQTLAARELGLPRRTLIYRMGRLNIHFGDPRT